MVRGWREAESESEDRYRLLVELSPDGHIVHQHGRTVYANNAALRLLGYSDEEVIGAPIIDFVAPASRAPMLARIDGLNTPGLASEPAELALLRRDGTTLAVESVSVPTRWLGEAAFQVVLRDLTREHAAAAAVRLQASLVEHVSDAIIATDTDGLVTSWNPAATLVYGWDAVDALGRHADQLLAPNGPRVTRRPSSRSVETHTRRDGTTLPVEVASDEIRDGGGEVSGRVLVCTDLSGPQEAEFRRRVAEERYTTAVAALDEGVVLVDGNGCVETCNPAASDLLGRSAGSLLGKTLVDAAVFIGEDGAVMPRDAHPAELARAQDENREPQNIGVRRADGSLVWLSMSARTLPARDAAPGHPVVLTIRDITEKLATTARLAREARHDDLTGLANRRSVLECLTKLIEGRRRPRAAVLFVDIDRFKGVNDSLGHDAGDRVLVEIGERIRRVGGSEDVIGRLAGDEFVFIASGIDDSIVARALANRLLDVIARPFDVDGRAVIVSASVGVALLSGSRYDRGEQVLRDADVAMYQAKQEAHPRVVIFDQELRVAAVQRLEMEVELREALRDANIWPAFQPLVRLADGHVVAVEALARWDHPDRGSVSPADFIPVAEEAGMIVALGEQILLEACTRAAAWHQEPGLAELGVSVNISTRQFATAGLTNTIAETLRQTGLAPSYLMLEITESVLMHDPVGAARTLLSIKDLGVRLALDDFGTGFSSLAYLRRFPVDSVKIDRSFIQEICDHTADRAIVASVIQLAHTLGLTVTAEGVEFREQLDVLAELGCDTVQGFLYAHPVPAADLSAAIARIHDAPLL